MLPTTGRSEETGLARLGAFEIAARSCFTFLPAAEEVSRLANAASLRTDSTRDATERSCTGRDDPDHRANTSSSIGDCKVTDYIAILLVS